MSLGEAARWLREDRRPVVLSGAWAGGGALLTSEPVRQAPPTADPFALFDGVAAPGGEDGSVGGGWFGWLGFGAAGRIERLPPGPPRPVRLPEFDLAWHDHLVRRDPDGQWWFEAVWTPARAAALAEREAVWAARLRGPAPARLGHHAHWPPLAVSGAGTSGHRVAVQEAIERIAAGEVFQVNLCLRWEAEWAGDLLEPWLDAIATVSPAYGAFIGGRDHVVASLSPELFLRRRGRTVMTRPIKGTAPADTDPAVLARSAKDRAENVMIVDLMRNDLGRVCEYGSVQVPSQCTVEPAAGVWHLVSTVTGRLRSDVGDGALLRATFPPGSVVGAPKVQALKLIRGLEATGREAYCGTIGFCSPVAGLELNVAIRTLERRGDRIWLGAGGAIMHDSDPEGEVTEALVKAAGVARALGIDLVAPPRGDPAAGTARLLTGPRPEEASGLIETVRVAGGRAIGAEGHLARLADGAALLELPWPPELSPALDEAATRLADGALRVKLDRAGWSVAVRPLPGAGPVRLEPVRLAGGLGALKWADRRLLESHSTASSVPLLCELDGSVLEAAHAGVFIVEADRIVAPPLDGRLLPSLSRARALAAAERAGLEVSMEAVSLSRARGAAALLLTSSLRGIHVGLLEGGPDRSACIEWVDRLRAFDSAL